MFNFLAEKLQGALKSLSGKGMITEADVDATLRELRIALLEADVALPAIKHLLAEVREKAVGQDVLKGVNPGQQVVKIVYDALVNLLGGETENPLHLTAKPPAVILLCGLQGSGKTTTAGKLAKWLQGQNKSVYLASLDVHRPAAITQLATLATRLKVDALESPSMSPVERTELALAAAKKAHADVLILDTAGRLEVADDLLAELAEIHQRSSPTATLLVADAQLGQAATQVAEAFKKTVPLTGLVLTRLDGDARGGAALSLKFVTGVPITFFGTGEALDKLEIFRPEGLAGRILGQGDVVSLVEKVAAASATEDTAGLEKKLMAGHAMDMNDLAKQLRMMRTLTRASGGLGGLMNLLPGMGGLTKQLEGKVDDKMLARQLAIIGSMTTAERKNPAILNGKRRLRIAKGSGNEVADVNKLVKMHDQMNQMAKMFRSGNFAGMFGKK